MGGKGRGGEGRRGEGREGEGTNPPLQILDLPLAAVMTMCRCVITVPIAAMLLKTRISRDVSLNSVSGVLANLEL